MFGAPAGHTQRGGILQNHLEVESLTGKRAVEVERAQKQKPDHPGSFGLVFSEGQVSREVILDCKGTTY